MASSFDSFVNILHKICTITKYPSEFLFILANITVNFEKSVLLHSINARIMLVLCSYVCPI